MANNSRVFSNLKLKITKAVSANTSGVELNVMAKELAKEITDNRRIGIGVHKNGRTYKLASKPLKEKTKKNRRKYSNNLSSLTKPNTSNLTATGTMLDAITAVAGRGKIIIFFRKITGKKLSGGASKATVGKIADSNEKKGRPFFYLAAFEKRDFERKLAAKIKASIRRRL